MALSTVGVTGASASAAAPQALQAVRVSSAGTTHAAVSPGTQLWAKQYGVSSGQINSVAVSPNGNTVFVTGRSSSAYATIAYNTATGAQLWTKLYTGGPGGSCTFDNAVAASPDGNTVYVTGQCETAAGHYDSPRSPTVPPPAPRNGSNFTTAPARSTTPTRWPSARVARRFS